MREAYGPGRKLWPRRNRMARVARETGDRMTSQDPLVAAATRIAAHLGKVLDVPAAIKLWDGTIVPLGKGDHGGRLISIAGPGALGTLVRKPSLDTVFRLYVTGDIAYEGTNLIELMDLLRQRLARRKIDLADLRKGLPLGAVLRFLPVRADAGVKHAYQGDEVASGGAARDNKAFVQFHYDVSNDFYALFLDREMVYSCAYFTDWSNGIDQAQRDKLDLICRKLRLKPGESFLDIGCGWGALLCHAAANYGVKAYGVTLSQAQFDFATAKVKRLGLEDRVTIELKDYNLVEGTFDKIASVGMYEHVGTAHYDVYFRKMRKLLAPEGIFLNHGITRRAVNKVRRRPSQSNRIILRYIFPGSELDDIGHTVQSMERNGFEVHDVENLRLHYGRTCNIWHDRLVARETEAVALVGRERYRMWIAYLAGVTGGFERTPLRIYQTVATRPLTREETPIPPTRADLYAPR